MNKNLVLFFVGTKIQNLVSALYHFGFLIIFFQATDSLIYSSSLTATTIIISRVTSIILVPHLKQVRPIRVSILMNFLIGIFALVSIVIYPLWNGKIIGYFIIAVVFSILEEMDNSFQYPIIPAIVEKDYLFKANSLSSIFTNINMIAAPLGSYLFYIYSDLRGFLLIYGVICLMSCVLLTMIRIPMNELKSNERSKKSKVSFWREWHKTLNLILKDSNILFCIAIGVVINLIFAGLNGAVLLKMGSIAENKVFGQTIIKISLSLGSIIGVLGVYKLKVKENYDRYLNLSILGLVLVILSLGLSTNFTFIYIEFFMLAIFIMFVMNSTGTFLQIVTPKNELPSIYVFRSTLYAIVVPISHIMAGIILQYFDKQYYFFFSCLLLISIIPLKKKSKHVFAEI